MNKELKNCAHCGGKAELDYCYNDGTAYSFYIICDECKIHTIDYRDKEEVIEVWNKRVICECEFVKEQNEDEYQDLLDHTIIIRD